MGAANRFCWVGFGVLLFQKAPGTVNVFAWVSGFMSATFLGRSIRSS